MDMSEAENKTGMEQDSTSMPNKPEKVPLIYTLYIKSLAACYLGFLIIFFLPFLTGIKILEPVLSHIAVAIFFLWISISLFHFVFFLLTFLAKSVKNQKIKFWMRLLSFFYLFIILSIIIPALKPARQSTHTNFCQSKLSQIHKALSEYSKDHDGCLPTTNKFYSDITANDLEESFFRCTRVADDIPLPHYALNQYISGKRLKDLPPDIVLCYECIPISDLSHNQFDLIDQRRHYSGSNILFANGKVELVEPDEIEKLVWEIPE